MPIDPRIPMGVQPIPFNNPFEGLAQLDQQRMQRAVQQQQIQTAKALEEERRRKTEEAQQQQQQKIAIADAYRAAFDPEKKSLDRPKFQSALVNGGYGPAWPEIAKALDDADKTSYEALTARTKADEAEMGYATTLAKQIIAAEFDDGVIDGVLTHAELNGHDIKTFQQLRQAQPDRFKLLVTNLAQPKDTPKPFSLGPGQVQFGPDGKELARVAPTVPPKADYTIGNQRFSGQTNQKIATGPESANQQNYSGTQEDADDIAQAIIRGEQPPDLTAMYRLGGPVRAALARGKYDLTKAQEDWQATKKYIQTLNGAQQVRLRQAVDFTQESLNSVKDLSQKWNASTFGPLSKAQLALGKSGTLGPEAKSIATRLDAQIGDIVSELATVYKGGNASTDESLKLAAKNLSAEWDAKTLMDNIAQINNNLNYRRNSMKTAGVSSIQGENAYAPPARTGGPGGALPPVSERKAGVTRATINGVERVWNGTGWALP